MATATIEYDAERSHDWRYTLDDGDGHVVEAGALSGDAVLRRLLGLAEAVYVVLETDGPGSRLPGGDGPSGWAAMIAAHNGG